MVEVSTVSFVVSSLASISGLGGTGSLVGSTVDFTASVLDVLVSFRSSSVMGALARGSGFHSDLRNFVRVMSIF